MSIVSFDEKFMVRDSDSQAAIDTKSSGHDVKSLSEMKIMTGLQEMESVQSEMTYKGEKNDLDKNTKSMVENMESTTEKWLTVKEEEHQKNLCFKSISTNFSKGDVSNVCDVEVFEEENMEKGEQATQEDAIKRVLQALDDCILESDDENGSK